MNSFSLNVFIILSFDVFSHAYTHLLIALIDNTLHNADSSIKAINKWSNSVVVHYMKCLVRLTTHLKVYVRLFCSYCLIGLWKCGLVCVWCCDQVFKLRSLLKIIRCAANLVWTSFRSWHYPDPNAVRSWVINGPDAKGIWPDVCDISKSGTSVRDLYSSLFLQQFLESL